MSIDVSPLETIEDLLACENLQEALLGKRSRSVLPAPALAAIRRAGGLLLGAWSDDAPRRSLLGALVDLPAQADGFAARLTVFFGVGPESIGRGIAQALRHAERAACLDADVELVFWWGDPLRSSEAHIAFNKLGAIAPTHVRNALGPVDDRRNAGLPTDRLRVEWWLNAPRVIGILDEHRPPPHLHYGLDQMQALTRTRSQANGHRRLVELEGTPTERLVLVEIPVDLSRLHAEDVTGAVQWRTVSRQAFELLFSEGYTIVGCIHEGGRSFHLFERCDRGTVLARSGAP